MWRTLSALLVLPLLLPLLLPLALGATGGDGGGRWRGASCCREAVVPGCAVRCKRAASTSDLEGHCRRSHEAELYNCLAERKRAKNGRGSNFIEDEEIAEVVGCCGRASSASCRSACEDVQTAAPADREATLRRLQDTACGQEDGAFWECHGGGPAAPTRPSHRLELLCCPLADTPQCGELCRRTYSLRWHDQGPRFETLCLDATLGEPRLRRCIRDAEAPCLPSSGQLHFCNGFTDGSTSLYRRWDHEADVNAKTEFIGWMRSGILGLPFRNLSIVTTGQCNTELRRLACLLHLRPCRGSDHHAGQICRSDCVRLLESCLSPAGVEADKETLCSLMSEPEPYCVVTTPPDTPPDTPPQQRPYQIGSPCLPSPCGPGKVCRVGAPNQSTYVCLPGCRLSTVSGRMVALGASVLLRSVDGASNQLSLLLCAPDGRGDAPHLTQCASVTVPRSVPCDAFGTKTSSGTVVHRGCLVCVCVDGDLLCRSTEECIKSSRSLRAVAAGSTAPCVHVHSLRSAFQRCAPSRLTYDPCEVSPCRPGHRCVPHPEICVDSLQPCAQHTCVPESSEAVVDATSACQRSQSSVTSVEESVWDQPYVACPVAADECAAPVPPCLFADDCAIPCANATALPSCGRALRLYFSRRRLAALGSRVPARAVLSALRRLVGTAECVLTGRLEAARQLTVTVTADRTAAAAVCRLEADKLRVWLSSSSPATAADPALWPVVFAELVPEPTASDAPVGGAPARLPLLLALAIGAARTL